MCLEAASVGQLEKWSLVSLPVKELRDPWSPGIPTEALSVPSQLTVCSSLAVWQHLVSPPQGEVGEAMVVI